VNPYYKFYLLYNGIRVGYPIKIGYEEQSGHRKLVYLRMLIPNIGLNKTYTIFQINDDYLNKIVELFNNATGYNVDLNDIVIGDIYYYPTDDLRFLSPILILYANRTNTTFNKIVVMRLYPDSPQIENIVNVLGYGYLAGDDLSIEKNILYVIKTGSHKIYEISPRKRGIIYVPIVEYLVLIAFSVAIVCILIYYIGKKKIQSRTNSVS